MNEAGLRARLVFLSALMVMFCKAGEKALVESQNEAFAYPSNLVWMWVR